MTTKEKYDKVCLRNWRDFMATKATSRKPLSGNRRSHALNATKHRQKLNMQNVTLEDGKKIKVSAREAKSLKKDVKKG